MQPAEDPDPPILQQFQCKDNEPLASLPTRVCTDTGKRYLLWSDVQHAFDDLDHVLNYGSRVLFEIDEHGEL